MTYGHVAAEAKRRSEVRGLAKRHRQHVRPVVANGGLGCMLGEGTAGTAERGTGRFMLGEGTSPLPTAFRRWVPSPRTFAALTGGTDPVVATPAEPDASALSGGEPGG